MKVSQIISTASLAAVSLAQTPPGFTPSVETKLEVIFGSKAVATPGDAFTKTGKIPEEYVRPFLLEVSRLTNSYQRLHSSLRSGRQLP